MLRTWTYRAWKPIVGILLVVLGLVIVLPLITFPVLLIAALFEPGDMSYGDRIFQAATLEKLTPSGLLYLNVALGVDDPVGRADHAAAAPPAAALVLLGGAPAAVGLHGRLRGHGRGGAHRPGRRRRAGAAERQPRRHQPGQRRRPAPRSRWRSSCC